MVITLGGLLADTPHTRPVPVTGSADTDMAQQLGLQPSRYEGPTGIVGVLHDHCKRAGLQSCSLWAAVPHYIGVTPNPKAALALLDRLGGLLGTRFEAMELSQAALAFERQVGRAVSRTRTCAGTCGSSSTSRRRRRRRDPDEGEDDAYGNLPSGEDIARRFEQFLAEQSDEDDDKA